MSRLIYLSRHGETDWNVVYRLQGQRDIPINERGQSQATGNGEALGRLLGRADGFDFVASPLGRTRETMERIRTAMGLDPHAYRTDDRLREVHFGDWQGRTYDELRRDGEGALIEARSRDKWDFRPPGEEAESYAELARRVRSWLDDVSEPTVAVAHGGVIRALFHVVGGMSGEEASRAPTPQDRLLKIEGDRIDWV